MRTKYDLNIFRGIKRTLLITFILFSFLTAKAQSTDTAKQVFISVEQEPSFPGGIDRFYLYLQHNLVYPTDAVKKELKERCSLVL